PVPTGMLTELHGTLYLGTCVRCIRQDYRVSEMLEKIEESEDGVPRCDKCGYPIKPGVVLFGEPLPQLDKAVYKAQCADYMLVLGSSLRVTPAAALPGFVLQKGGSKVAIINQGKTDYDDEYGVTKVDAPLAEAMPIVLATASEGNSVSR